MWARPDGSWGEVSLLLVVVLLDQGGQSSFFLTRAAIPSRKARDKMIPTKASASGTNRARRMAKAFPPGWPLIPMPKMSSKRAKTAKQITVTK